MIVRVGIVGCGRIALWHVERLSRISKVQIAAFYDVVPERANDLAKSVGAKTYSNLATMLSKEKLDAVYVCVPPFARGFETEIIEHGIDLFVEKPVALTMETARRIERSISKAGIISSVGYMWRYFDTITLAKKVLEEVGPIGMVEGLYTANYVPDLPGVTWWDDKRKSGGQALEQTTHIFDLARYFIGDVIRVYGEMDTLLLKDVPGFKAEDVSIITLRFKSGAIGTVLSTTAGKKSFNRWGLDITARNAVVQLVGHSWPEMILRIYSDSEIREVKPTVDPYYEESKTFIDAVAKGDGSAIKSSYSDAVKTLEVTIAANLASSTNKVVTIG